MPDEPIINRIVDAIIEALEQIQVENGFHQSVTVEEYDLLTFVPADNKLSLSPGDPKRVGDEAMGMIEWNHPFVLDCMIVRSEEDRAPPRRRIMRLRSDIEKVLEDNAQWGYLAVDTQIDDPEYSVYDQGQAVGVTVNFTVHYRTLRNDPSKIGN